MADVKVQFNGKQWTITLPEEIIQHMQLQKGDVLRFYIDRESREVTLAKIENDNKH